MRLEAVADREFRVTGRLDFDSVPGFLDRAAEALEKGGRLDLSGVEHIDSAGVAALLWLRQQQGPAGLELVNLPRQGRAMAEVASVAGLLEEV